MNPYRQAEVEVASGLDARAEACRRGARYCAAEPTADNLAQAVLLQDLEHVCREISEILRIPSIAEFKEMSASQRAEWCRRHGYIA